MRRLSSLVLALVLLLGQATLLAHEYDFAIHKDGADCSICLHATPLSNAAVGTLLFYFPPADNSAELHPIESQLTLITNSLYRARAPPFSPSL
ncbi:MAG: hypothetical protein U1B30_07270 [Pseudomonadota bacterium]|nr:hypothetical protein [Pseudomonadota bacterium]